MNFIILLTHIFSICGLTLVALKLGKSALTAWLSLVAVALNLFVLKQVKLLGLDVTASDALAVGYLLGLNLMQEFYGRKAARKTIWITLFVAASFLLISQIELAYRPNAYDTAQPHLLFLFRPMVRLVIASLTTFVCVQYFDVTFFSFLRKKTGGDLLTIRTTLSLICSQTLDTLLFSFLGLYGIVHSLPDIILVSLAIKGCIIVLTTPFIALSKRMVPAHV